MDAALGELLRSADAPALFINPLETPSPFGRYITGVAPLDEVCLDVVDLLLARLHKVVDSVERLEERHVSAIRELIGMVDDGALPKELRDKLDALDVE
jgi:hypothetical protein